MKDEVLKLVLKHVNIKGLVMELLDDVLEKAVNDAVAKSETKIDDGIVPLIYPVLEKELLAKVEEKLDLEKLLGLKGE